MPEPIISVEFDEAQNCYQFSCKNQNKVHTGSLKVFTSAYKARQKIWLHEQIDTNTLELVTNWEIISDVRQFFVISNNGRHSFALTCSQDWSIYEFFDQIRNSDWQGRNAIDYFQEKALEKFLCRMYKASRNPKTTVGLKDLKKSLGLTVNQLYQLMEKLPELLKLEAQKAPFSKTFNATLLPGQQIFFRPKPADYTSDDSFISYDTTSDEESGSNSPEF